LPPDPTIDGHPVLELEGSDNPVLITVCAECGEMRTILWLTDDRWYCRTCRAAGSKPPNLYPVA
jgi:hypothetical protein